jgi:hypothetical protein
MWFYFFQFLDEINKFQDKRVKREIDKSQDKRETQTDQSKKPSEPINSKMEEKKKTEVVQRSKIDPPKAVKRPSTEPMPVFKGPKHSRALINYNEPYIPSVQVHEQPSTTTVNPGNKKLLTPNKKSSSVSKNVRNISNTVADVSSVIFSFDFLSLAIHTVTSYFALLKSTY